MGYGKIIADVKEKSYILVEKITSFKAIEGDAKKYFLGNNPCSYETEDGKVFICGLSEIVKTDFGKFEAKIGGIYKIHRSHIQAEV